MEFYRVIRKILNLKTKEEKAEIKRRRLASIRKEAKALYSICLSNVRYIRSSIKVHKSVSVTAQGANAAETKRKRDHAKSMVSWYEKKLIEEEGLVLYYKKLSTVGMD